MHGVDISLGDIALAVEMKIRYSYNASLLPQSKCRSKDVRKSFVPAGI
jgi:hypothetical protein